jgi:hypothetical protein
MRIEQMAKRLGIDSAGLRDLRSRQRNRCLPLNYSSLSEYLGSQLLQRQNDEWVQIMEALGKARNRASRTVSVTFLVGINRFFPENFPQNQNNLPC